MARENLDSHMFHLEQLRDYYISQVEKTIPNVKLNGSLKNRLPGNANMSFSFIDGEALLLELDQKGICASSGSACSSRDPKPSHVLKALGLEDDMANSALRVSFGDDNSKEDVDYLVENLMESVEKLREAGE